MNTTERAMASLSMQLLQSGKTIDYVYEYLRSTRPNVPENSVGIALEYASRAHDWAMSAQSGRFQYYHQIPGINLMGGDARVRLYIEGEGKYGAVQGSIDVIVSSFDTISAVYEYGFAQLNDWLSQYPQASKAIPRSKLLGGDAVRITMIQPERDSFSEAKITYQGV